MNIAHKFIILVMITFIGGCASPQPKVDVVAQTLQTYQVGKTTFADFKKDAGLVIVERPTPKMPTSYLSPQPTTPDELRPKTQKVYAVPVGSPWKIYESKVNEDGIGAMPLNFLPFVSFVALCQINSRS